MEEYRMYFLDAGDRFKRVKPFEASRDTSAVDIVDRIAQGRPYELWHHNRLVKRRKPAAVAPDRRR
jgi:hypothetical protein